MTWLVNHPYTFAMISLASGVIGREVGAFFFDGLTLLFFSLAVFSEHMQGF